MILMSARGRWMLCPKCRLFLRVCATCVLAAHIWLLAIRALQKTGVAGPNGKPTGSCGLHLRWIRWRLFLPHSPGSEGSSTVLWLSSLEGSAHLRSMPTSMLGHVEISAISAGNGVTAMIFRAVRRALRGGLTHAGLCLRSVSFVKYFYRSIHAWHDDL